MRQPGQGALRIIAHFEPVSFLLASSGYIRHLEQMLRESEDSLADDRISALMSRLQKRKREHASHPAPTASLIGLRELERVIHFDLIGRMDLPPSVKMKRFLAARAEVTRIAALV
jgi:streptomycin 6-kinase